MKNKKLSDDKISDDKMKQRGVKLFYRDKYGEHFYDPVTGMLLSRILDRERMTARGGISLNNNALERFIYSDVAYEYGYRRGWTNSETESYFETWMRQAAEDMKDLR